LRVPLCRVFPDERTALTVARTNQYSPPPFKLINIDSNEDLERALLEVANTKALVYATIARKHNINHSTLSRRVRGVQVFRTVSIQITSRLLSNAQEEVILQQMEYLSNKCIYLAPRIIYNSIQAIVGHLISKN
jgi:hypothetical protein